MPPPGWQPPDDSDLAGVEANEQHVEVEGEELPFVCDCLLDDGQVCGQAFKLNSTLALHTARSKRYAFGCFPGGGG